jgi:hypothetical protein
MPSNFFNPMKIKLPNCMGIISWLLVINVLLGALWIPSARADAGWFSAILVGKWRHAQSGERYHFRSDGSYTFWTGKAARRSGTLEYSGRWRTFNPDPTAMDMEPIEWGLKLHALQRVVRVGSRRQTMRANVGFIYRYAFPGPPDQAVRLIVIAGKRFVREG